MFDEFEQELVQSGASRNTVSAYLLNMHLYVEWFEASTGTRFDGRVCAFDAREYRSYLTMVKKQKPSTVNAKLAALQRYADFATAAGRQEAIRVEKQKVVTIPEVRVLSKADLYKCRRWAYNYASKRDIAIFETLLNTGIRESELASLELDDLSITERKGTLTVRNGKGGKYRTVPLNVDARNALQAYLDARPASQERQVFLGQRGSLTRNAIFRVIRGIGAKGAGVELTPHTLRHQCFTAMVRAGTDVATIASIAGHADTRITSRYYLATAAEDREKAVDGLNF